MTRAPSRTLADRLRLGARVAAAVAALGGVAVAVGWAFDLLPAWALLVLANAVVFAGFVWWYSTTLARADRHRRRIERRLAVQHTVTAVLADSPGLDDAVPKVLRAVGESLGWEAGLMWRVDDAAWVLRYAVGWHAPGSPAAGFVAASRGYTFSAGVGLPGRAWETGRPTWARDITQATDFPLDAGLRAGFAFSIQVDGVTAGVMEFFHRNSLDPDDDLLQTVAAVGSQVGLFVKRRRAEDDAARARHLLDSLLTHLPDSVYFKDDRGRFLRVSAALAARLGLADPAAAVGKTDFDFFPAEYARPAFDDEQEVMRSGRPMVDKEEGEVRPDGTAVWVLTTKVPLRDPGGAIVGTFGVSRDITRRRRSEEALRVGELRFRSLVEATAAIVWSTPASGEFEAEQPGWTAFTGQTFAQLRGWGWLDAVHPDDRASTTRAWKAAVATRSLYQVEHRLRRHDGAYLHMLVRAVPILDRADGIREWVGVHTDVDAETRAGEAMRAAKDAADAATRAKSEFLANMSHEIRTPLNGILGMTELALDTTLSPEQREYLGLVKSSADHLLTVINDILDFSKIEAGKLDLESVDFDLRDTLDDTVATLAVRAHKKGLELADHVAPDVPDAVAGDPHRLRQILVNLIGNAIKFTDRGEVVLEVTQAAAAPAGEVVLHFAVRDSGIGIAPTQRDRLFQAFTQADTSTTRKYGGTGLGLAISSRLVELMGGRIWLESEEGVGSTFHFTARLAPARGPRPAQARPEQVKGLAVLVVDDNETNRRILHEMLTNWGMRPTDVDGGRPALAELERARAAGEPYPLVLLDAMMPEMDGFDLAERIRRDTGLAAATLMMLSSAGQREDAERCRALGVAAYLTKPVRQSILLDTIMTALGPTAVPAGRAETPPAWGRTARPLRLLLAEDNAVNQTLAVRLLEKRGHAVTVAGNGREAVEKWCAGGFDAVLMDVQMPEVDGFEATAAIRAREAESGAHTPIIAMTAHAMKGDRENCLAAGMDQYVSKPLRPEDLFAVLEGLGGGTVSAAVAEPVRGGPAFDAAAALRRAGGDEDLLRELAGLCVEECPPLMAAIRVAVADRDAAKLRAAAHSLKGTVATFAAEEAHRAAGRLELAGRDGDWPGAADALPELETAVGRLLPALGAVAASR